MTASIYDALPGEQGITNAVDRIGSGQKTATGHVESSLGETGIDPRIETGLPESESEHDGIGSGPKTATDHVATVRGRTETETTTASDALDRLTSNGKRSESENGSHGHESCPTESGLYDPSLFLNPKIGKHGKIENGSGPPKLLLTHHAAEHAAMSGEKQPRKQCGQGESAATEQPPPLQLPKELKRQRHARAQQTNVQRHFHPSRWTEVEREERKPHGTQHQVNPRDTSPSYPAPLKGGKKRRRKSRAAELPKKFSLGAKPPAQGEQRLKGVIFKFLISSLFSKKFPLRQRPTSTKVTSHVTRANFAPTHSTSGVGIPVQRGQECATFSAPHPRTNS